MKITVGNIALNVLNMRTRMPFRYGIATLTALPHLFVRVELDVDGKKHYGLAADGLPPKWFTKDPSTSFKDDLGGMIEVIRSACGIAKSAGPSASVFELWQKVYAGQKTWAATTKYPPLLWNFGVSLIERAVIDAFCRASKTTFSQALRENTLGVKLGEMRAEFGDSAPRDLLTESPLRSIIARHTVGLSDPLTDEEISAAERLDDGLPQSLESCIRFYGLTYFKIKLFGDVPKDVARLKRISEIIGRAASGKIGFTLDGNENFKSVEPFKTVWQDLLADASIRPFLKQLIFVEQPFHRDVALSDELQSALQRWRDRPPIIIDESDADFTSLPRALECGYVGTSHKNCKGIFKGIANACRIAQLNAQAPPHPQPLSLHWRGEPYMLSGEDLCNVGPVALLQDLAVMAALGIEHIERNGHHYFAGLSMLPQDVQEQTLMAHAGLYHRGAKGFAALNIQRGAIDVGSAIEAPFGYGFDLDTTRFTPLSEWTYESLA